MYISGNFSSFYNPNIQNPFEQFQKEFQQLGKDLTAGDLSAAQSDFATLEEYVPQANSTSSTSSTSTSQSNNPIAQAFQQLSQDLQSGNLSAAQQDYSTIQQDFQNQTPQVQHHHHRFEGSQETQQSQFAQLFAQLGQDLQSGDLKSAQSAFTSLQKVLPSYYQQTTSSTSSTSTSQSQNPVAQAFQQLSQDLQSGNLSAAQQDYSTIQQDFQGQTSEVHHHHHHRSGGSQESQQSQFAQLFAQLGQDLQSGDLSSAQSVFSSLQKLLPSYYQQTTSGTSTGSTSGKLSINA
jgi:outer membrane protein assembly factor BamD (BamD/ComL family)